MSYTIYQAPRSTGKSIVVWSMELTKIAKLLKKGQKVIWDIDPKTAREIAEGLGIRKKLSIRGDVRSFKTVVQLK